VCVPTAMNEEVQLESHDLIRRPLQKLEPILIAGAERLKRHAEKTGEFRIRNAATLPEPHSYHHEVFYYTTALLGAVGRLEEAQTYLEVFPQVCERVEMTRAQWIDYHYSTYVITLVSLYDIALILTSVVFRLGIPPRHCRDSVIKENRWVKTTPVKSALDGLHRCIKPYIESRHLLVHRGEVPQLEQFDTLRFLSFANKFSDPLVDPEDLQTWYVCEITLLGSKLFFERDEIKKAAWNLFDALLPVYQARVEEVEAFASTAG